MSPNSPRIREHRFTVQILRIPLKQSETMTLQDEVQTSLLLLAALGFGRMHAEEKWTGFLAKNDARQRDRRTIYVWAASILDTTD
jgi:hypothetical protein